MGKEITILGVGGAGCRILREISQIEAAKELQLLALDSDAESLENSGLPEDHRLLAAPAWRSGRGCGGDDIAGQRAVAGERAKLAQFFSGTSLLLVVCGLGGGIASGGMAVILSVAAKMRITTFVLASLPFSMEGYRRRKIADEKLTSEILPLADAVVTLPCDLLFAGVPPETPLAEGYLLANCELARTALALTAIFGSDSLFSADFASFTALLRRRPSLCAIGTAAGSGEDAAPERLLEKVISSPLLGGASRFSEADAVMFTLLGGTELSLGAAKNVLDSASRQIGKTDRPYLLGAAVSPQWQGKLQLTCLLIHYTGQEESSAVLPKEKSHSRRAKANADGFEQMTLSLTSEDKGIMANTTPVIVDGVDLDIPAFRRQNLLIDPGK